MHNTFDYLEFALSVVAAVVFSALVVVGAVTGRLHLGRQVSISFRERSGAFLGWLLLFAWVAFLSAREVIELLHRFGTS